MTRWPVEFPWFSIGVEGLESGPKVPSLIVYVQPVSLFHSMGSRDRNRSPCYPPYVSEYRGFVLHPLLG
jgi:hypothetical protein